MRVFDSQLAGAFLMYQIDANRLSPYSPHLSSQFQLRGARMRCLSAAQVARESCETACRAVARKRRNVRDIAGYIKNSLKAGKDAQ